MGISQFEMTDAKKKGRKVSHEKNVDPEDDPVQKGGYMTKGAGMKKGSGMHRPFRKRPSKI